MHVKPIDLRRKSHHLGAADVILGSLTFVPDKILFYLGHIPAFLQIHLSKHFGESFTEPASYASIFERGIDPHVRNLTSSLWDHMAYN